jgi:hypothetical protein
MVTMNRIEINTYPEFWKIEMSITSIEGRSIPFELTLKKIFYFVVTFLFMVLLLKLPLLNKLIGVKYIGHPFFLFVVLPGIMTHYLNRQKIDGKQPYIYFIDMVVFLLSAKEFEFFRPVSKSEVIKGSSIKIYFRVEELISTFSFKGKELDKKVYRHSYNYL